MRFFLGCDLCDAKIRDIGYSHETVEARLVVTDHSDTAPRVTERGQIMSLLLCARCAARTHRFMRKIRAETDAKNGGSAGRTACPLPSHDDGRGRGFETRGGGRRRISTIAGTTRSPTAGGIRTAPFARCTR